MTSSRNLHTTPCYLEMFKRTNAKWIQREMSAYAQNPPPFSAEQWWKPPPKLMAHPLSTASLAAKMEPPTCKKFRLSTKLKLQLNQSFNSIKNRTFYLFPERIKNFLLHEKIRNKCNRRDLKSNGLITWSSR